MRRIYLWIGLGALLGLALVGAFALNRPYTMKGSTIQQPYAAPDFSLPDGQGSQFRLSDQQGKLVLIFFGYTSCPDVCPTTLSDFKQIRKRLGKDADRVQFVFITVDPDRDTSQKVASYVQGFDPTFVGLSGSEQQLEPVWKAYGVYRQLNKANPDDKAYEVEHSSQVYLVDAKGNLRSTYVFGMSVDDLLQDVRYVLKKG